MSIFKVAYLVSHPIQYQAPLLRAIAAHPEIDLKVFFLSDFSLRGYQDEGFGATVEWDVPLLDGYKHEFLPAWGKTAPLNPLRPLSRGVWRALRAGGFDALWMHGYAHSTNLRALHAAKSMNIKVLIRAESQAGSALRAPGTRDVKETLLRALLAQIDGFLCIGSLNRAYYQNYGVPESKLFSMPYAVDNAFFQARALDAHPQREALRAKLDLQPGRPIILFASKFVARKRAGDLLEAYARLSPDGKREPVPYLLFVGDGEQRLQLETRAATLGWQSIRFLGFKNQTELPALYDLCDVFALPSEREPWGLVVNEVMNAGKPLVVTDGVGSAPDLVRDGDNGFIVPVGDVAALSDRLWQMTAFPDKAQRMGKASRRIIENWSFRENVEGLLHALHAVVPTPNLAGKRVP